MLKIKDLAKGLKNQGSEFGKLAGKKILTKSAEAAGDLIESKIADKITSFKSKEKHQVIESERFQRKKKKLLFQQKKDRKF